MWARENKAEVLQARKKLYNAAIAAGERPEEGGSESEDDDSIAGEDSQPGEFRYYQKALKVCWEKLPKATRTKWEAEAKRRKHEGPTEEEKQE